MSEPSAHAISLHLYELLKRLSPKTVAEARTELSSRLALMGLAMHLLPVERDGDIVLDPITKFGKELLRELVMRSEFPPCPEGECEYDTTGACKWCGAIKKE